MERHGRFILALLALALVVLPVRGSMETPAADTTTDGIRKELMQLPYYGVFDFLAFSYDRGTVALAGFAYHPGLKSDAVRAAKRASGVDTVTNKIEELPASQNDDELRWKVYYAIYRDPFLSRYA